jgi:hypothetical protein
MAEADSSRDQFWDQLECSEEVKLRLRVIGAEYNGQYSVKQAAQILKMSEEVYCHMRDEALQGMLDAMEEQIRDENKGHP